MFVVSQVNGKGAKWYVVARPGWFYSSAEGHPVREAKGFRSAGVEWGSLDKALRFKSHRAAARIANAHCGEVEER